MIQGQGFDQFVEEFYFIFGSLTNTLSEQRILVL
jgi:hypothetical protein